TRIGEDDEKGVSHRGLLVKVVDEPEDALDPGMEDEGCEAIEHERTRAPLIEEGRGRGPNVFEPTRVHVPDPAERRHAEDVSAVDGRPGRIRRHPKERGPRRR